MLLIFRTYGTSGCILFFLPIFCPAGTKSQSSVRRLEGLQIFTINKTIQLHFIFKWDEVEGTHCYVISPPDLLQRGKIIFLIKITYNKEDFFNKHIYYIYTFHTQLI